MHLVASLFACALALAPLALPAAAAHDDSAYARTVSWLLAEYPRDAAPGYPQSIAISGCDLLVTRRPDGKTNVTTRVHLRDAQISAYAGPGSSHVDFLTSGIFPVRFRFADGSTSTGGTAVAWLTARRGDQAVRIARAFDRLRASCADRP